MVALIASIACDSPRPVDPGASPPGAPDRGTPSAPVPVAGDVVAEPPASPWPTDVEDLAAGLESFTTVEACVASLRGTLPTAIAEGLADLEYDAFVEDVCRATAAVRDRSPEGCDALEVSSLRRGCRRRLAIVAGDPALCPEDRAIDGRDPLCVAWAARDPGLCRAAAAHERDACEAVLGAEPRRCARALDRARCEAWIRRYARALGEERSASEGPREEPSLHLEIVRVVPTASGPPSESPPVTLDLDVLARGVFLATDGCAHRVVLDHRGERAAILGRSGARIELPIAISEPPVEITLAPGATSIELAHPSLGRARGGEGSITLTELGLTRGAPLAGTIDASLPAPPGTWRFRGTFRTFVRDLDDLPERCAGGTMPSP